MRSLILLYYRTNLFKVNAMVNVLKIYPEHYCIKQSIIKLTKILALKYST
jgi:hypothetical protein